MRRSALFQKIFGTRIVSGPFKGGAYVGDEVFSAKGIGAKILGTYEKDLHPVIEESLRRPHDLIVNVGAADGYYVVGLARRSPGVKVLAFEANEDSQKLLRSNISANGIAAQIDVRGWCGPKELDLALNASETPLLVVDVEGAEKELLNPEEIPSLRKAEILVEIHDFFDPAIGDLLRSRFSSSHDILEIQEQQRTIEDLPGLHVRFLGLFFKHKGVQWMAEGRPGLMRWFHMTPRR